jgi:hypothetical protein
MSKCPKPLYPGETFCADVFLARESTVTEAPLAARHDLDGSSAGAEPLKQHRTGLP